MLLLAAAFPLLQCGVEPTGGNPASVIAPPIEIQKDSNLGDPQGDPVSPIDPTLVRAEVIYPDDEQAILIGVAGAVETGITVVYVVNVTVDPEMSSPVEVPVFDDGSFNAVLTDTHKNDMIWVSIARPGEQMENEAITIPVTQKSGSRVYQDVSP